MTDPSAADATALPELRCWRVRRRNPASGAVETLMVEAHAIDPGAILLFMRVGYINGILSARITRAFHSWEDIEECATVASSVAVH